MPDVYGLDPKVAGVVSGTNFSLSVSTGGAGTASAQSQSGLMVQAFQLQYSRQVSRVYELGSRNQYYVEGNTEGMGTLAQVLGPLGLADVFTNLLTGSGSGSSNSSGICNTANNVLTLNSGYSCKVASPTTSGSSVAYSQPGFALAAPVITSMSIGQSVQNFVLNRAYNLMFSSLTNTNTGR